MGKRKPKTEPAAGTPVEAEAPSSYHEEYKPEAGGLYVIHDSENGVVVRWFPDGEQTLAYRASTGLEESKMWTANNQPESLAHLPLPLLKKVIAVTNPEQAEKAKSQLAAAGYLHHHMFDIAGHFTPTPADAPPVGEESSPTEGAQETQDMAGTTIGKGDGKTSVKELRSAKKSTKGSGKVKTTRAAGPKAERAPRVDEYTGKKIRLVGKDNPRREGTHGFKSMEVVRNNPGILYEDYIKKGGRRVDLVGSIGLKQVELK